MRSPATTGRGSWRRRACRGRSRAISTTSPGGGWHAGRVAAEPAVYRRMARGNQSIADAAARLLPDVRLGRRATSVIERRGRVEIGAGDDRIDADAVVVAVPVRLVTELAFDPPLPSEQREAFEGLPMGVASKLALPLGGEPGRCAIQCADLPFWFWVADGDDGRPRRVVTSFAGSELPQEALATASGDPRVGAQDRRAGARAPAGRQRGDEGLGPRRLVAGRVLAWDHPSVARRPQFERMHGAIAFAGSTRPATIPERWRARFGAASERCRRCSSCSATRERADAQA